MPLSSWLVGSVQLEASGFDVNGVPVATPGGLLYLRSANPLLSLVDLLEAAIQTQVPTAALFVTQGRRVRLLPQPGEPVAIAWNANTVLRDLLGFAGDLSSSDEGRSAPNVSPLLWSPGWLATPETRLGTAGWVHTDAARHTSSDGTRHQVTTFYEQVRQVLSWTEIEADRMRRVASANGGGTFHELYERSLKRGYSVRWYVEQLEVEGDDTPVTWDDSATGSFGPYVLTEPNARYYSRVVANADLYSPLELQLQQVAEYT